MSSTILSLFARNNAAVCSSVKTQFNKTLKFLSTTATTHSEAGSEAGSKAGEDNNCDFKV